MSTHKLILGVALTALTVLSATPASAELLSPARTVDWTAGVAVGVPGGIPTDRTRLIDVTLPPYNADNTGLTNASPAIQAAVNAAKAHEVVYLPPGTYLVTTTVTVGHNKDNISIRGAGPDKTLIKSRINTVFSVGSSSDYLWHYPKEGNVVKGGLYKGSDEVEVDDTSMFPIGHIVQIGVSNQVDDSLILTGSTPTVSVAGYPTLRRQLSRVISKTTKTLKLFPTVHFTPEHNLQARINVAQFQSEFVGIEGLAIDGTDGAMVFPIVFDQCYASWIDNVRITNTTNYGMYLTDSLNCEVRRCVIRDRKTGGSNGAGVLLGHVGNSLIEDNIVAGISPAIEVNFSSTGNVIAYNLLENSVGGTLNTNHGPHNSFNLYEGNVTPNVQSDGYFGSASDDTFFRNWIHGTNATKTLRTWMISLNRFTRNYSFVGNIMGESGTTHSSPYSFGNPNMGNSTYKGQAKPTSGSFWKDWKTTATLSTRISDTAGSITLNSGSVFPGQLLYLRWKDNSTLHGISSAASVSGNVVSWTGGTGAPLPSQGTTVQVFFGPAGYQESDLDVEATTIRKGNYFFGTKGIPSSESISPADLPLSLFRSTKPSWFGELAWPPFDPFSPNPTFASIPAAYRYINKSDVASGTEAKSPANVRVQIQSF